MSEAFFKIVNARRSVRRFATDPVPRKALEQIAAAGLEAPSGANMQLRQFVIVDDPKMMDSIRIASPSIDSAPAAVVLLIEPKASKYGEFYVQDASAAMENMLLAAVALGYASVWIEGGVRGVEAELRKALGVPENLRVWAIVPVGKPAETPARPEKTPFAQAVHYNRFGGKK